MPTGAQPTAKSCTGTAGTRSYADRCADRWRDMTARNGSRGQPLRQPPAVATRAPVHRAGARPFCAGNSDGRDGRDTSGAGDPRVHRGGGRMKVAALHIPSRHCARLGAPFGPVVFVARAVLPPAVLPRRARAATVARTQRVRVPPGDGRTLSPLIALTAVGIGRPVSAADSAAILPRGLGPWGVH